jgi:putative oxidoreductase
MIGRSRDALYASTEARLRAMQQTLSQFSLPLLRVALGVVYIWFGALKFTDSSPVGELVAKTVPFLPSHLFVPALGGFEVLVGIGLLIGRRLALVALLMVAHLAGTFLVLVTEPSAAFQHGDPLMLTMTGEFVVKNVVLITAGLVLITHIRSVEGAHADRAPAAEGVAVGGPAPAVEPAFAGEPALAAVAEPADGLVVEAGSVAGPDRR